MTLISLQKKTILAIFFASTCLLSNIGVTAEPAECAAEGWCVEFLSANAVIDNNGDEPDITLLYAASQPTDEDDSKFYTVTVMEEACSTILQTDGAVTPILDTEGRVPVPQYNVESGTLSVELDIDNDTIEASPFSSPKVNGEFTVKFCVKVDLWTTLAEAVLVEQVKTIVEFSIDLKQGFDLAGFAAAMPDATLASREVAVNYDLQSCICGDNNDECISPPPFKPGTPFTFCVSSLSDEAQVKSLRDVSFFNGQDAENSIPIINADGQAVGPTGIDCDSASGVCRVNAISYAALYLKRDGDQLIDISASNEIRGTSILELQISDVAWFETNQDVWQTYQYETAFCSSRGMQLCSYDQLCPNGKFSAPANHDANLAERWVAVADSTGCPGDAWVQTGDHAGFDNGDPEQCFRHEDTALFGTCPDWGTTPSNAGSTTLFAQIPCCPSSGRRRLRQLASRKLQDQLDNADGVTDFNLVVNMATPPKTYTSTFFGNDGSSVAGTIDGSGDSDIDSESGGDDGDGSGKGKGNKGKGGGANSSSNFLLPVVIALALMLLLGVAGFLCYWLKFRK